MSNNANRKKHGVIVLILIMEALYIAISLSGIVFAQKMHVDYMKDELLSEETSIVTPETVLPVKGIYTVDVYMEVDDANTTIITSGKDPTIGNMLGSEGVYLENGEDHFAYDIYARLNGIATETTVYPELKSEEGTVTIERISIDYQKWHSFSYYLISLLFRFCLIDVILFALMYRKDRVRVFIQESGLIFMAFFAAVIIASLPVMVKDIPKGDDLVFHLMRIQGIADGIKAGYFPVRIHDRWFNDYGLPAGVFYGQILLYPFAILRVLGFPLGHTYRLYVIFINLLTVILSYYSFKKILNNKYYASATTVFYTLALYRLMDIHKRSALGEYTAMAFLPLIILGMGLLYDYFEGNNKNRAWLYMAIGMTGVLQSHMLTVFMLVIMGAIIVILNIRRTFCKSTLLQYVKAFLLVVLLNLFYIVPFIDYYMSYSLMMKEMNKDIAAKAAYLPQIFAQAYNVKGYNGEHTPVGDMPMSVGVSVLFIMAMLTYLGCRCGLKKYRRVVRDTFIIFSAFVIMASDVFPYNYLREYCRPVYDLFQRMQYPWRFLTIVTLLCTSLFMASIVMVDSEYGKRTAAVYAIVILGITLLQSKGMEDSIINEKDGKSYYSMTDTFWNVCEYLPRNTDIEELYDTDLLTSDARVEAKILERKDINSIVEVNNMTEKTGYVQLPQLCYPHYRSVDKDGNDLEVIVGDYYKMCFGVPAGYKGTVRTFFQEPLSWRIAETISLLTLGILLYSVLYIIKKAKSDND